MQYIFHFKLEFNNTQFTVLVCSSLSHNFQLSQPSRLTNHIYNTYVIGANRDRVRARLLKILLCKTEQIGPVHTDKQIANVTEKKKTKKVHVKLVPPAVLHDLAKRKGVSISSVMLREQAIYSISRNYYF